MNKRAAATDIILLVVVALIVTLFFAGWMYVHNNLTETIIGKNINAGTANVSEIAEDTLGQVNEGINFLKVISYLIIFAMMISILISNFLVKANPVFYVVYFLVGIVAIIFSVFVSNAYENLLTNNALGTTLSGFTGTNFLMAQLPIIVGVIAILGAIFLFINVPRDTGLGGGVI